MPVSAGTAPSTIGTKQGFLILIFLLETSSPNLETELSVNDVKIPRNGPITVGTFPSCDPVGCNPADLPYTKMTEKCRYGIKDVSFFLLGKIILQF